MGVTSIIDFDNNPHGTYFAGQVLTGKVTLKLDKVKLVKAVTLNINGYAETRWTESRGTGKHRHTDTYQGREDYIASQTYLAGSSMSTEVSLEPGIHVYNFACQIPVTCPSSIEGNVGRVRYMIKISLVRPWKFDQSYTRCFTVLKLMDLNYESPTLRVPVHCETQKTYCCWPCQSEPLQLQLTLSQTGFVPGQEIPVNMLITNDSHIRVEMLQISLVMLVTYYAKHMVSMHSRNQRFVVTKLMGDPVPNHCKKQFKYLMRVPATPPTCYNLCGIIKIAYQVEVEAKVKGCHKDEKVTVPMTIGSIPLSENVLMQPRGLPMQTLDVAALNNPTAPPPPPLEADAPWAMAANMQPPNYEEAVFMRSAGTSQKMDDAEDSTAANTVSLDGSSFTPIYPIFNMPTPTAPEDHTDNANAETNTNKGTGTWL